MFKLRVFVYLTYLLTCSILVNSKMLKSDSELNIKQDETTIPKRIPISEITEIEPFPIPLPLKCPRPIIIIIIIYIPCSRKFTDDFYPLDIALPGNFIGNCKNRKQYFIRIKSCIPYPRPLPRPFPPFDLLQRIASPAPRIRIIIIIIIIRRERAMLARNAWLSMSSSCKSFEMEEFTPPEMNLEYADMLLNKLPMSRADMKLLGNRKMIDSSQEDLINENDIMNSIKQRIEMIKKSDSC